MIQAVYYIRLCKLSGKTQKCLYLVSSRFTAASRNNTSQRSNQHVGGLSQCQAFDSKQWQTIKNNIPVKKINLDLIFASKPKFYLGQLGLGHYENWDSREFYLNFIFNHSATAMFSNINKSWTKDSGQLGSDLHFTNSSFWNEIHASIVRTTDAVPLKSWWLRKPINHARVLFLN